MPARVVDLQDYTLDIEQEVRRAADALVAGELIVVPTETVYGIAGKPNTPAGIARLAELRSGSKTPLTPHLPDASAAGDYLDAAELSQTARRLMAKLWPGPVALMFDVSEARRRD